ncbi:MAG: 4Fe-4S ferredoxin, partial [Bacteroidota bacterium]
KCCYCQLCVFPCPTECIYMTDVYEFAEYERNNLVYKFTTLTEEEAVQKKINYEKFQAEKEAAKQTGTVAAAKTKSEASVQQQEEKKNG